MMLLQREEHFEFEQMTDKQINKMKQYITSQEKAILTSVLE